MEIQMDKLANLITLMASLKKEKEKKDSPRRKKKRKSFYVSAAWTFFTELVSDPQTKKQKAKEKLGHTEVQNPKKEKTGFFFCGFV